MTRYVQRSRPTSGSSPSSRDRGLTTRLAVIAGAVTAFVALFSGTALAHATYKSSNPADESTVAAAPSQITAEFTEPMTGGSLMDVTDPCGRDSGTGSSQTGSSMSVQNTSSAAGTYTVFWRAVSVDSHTTEGEFTFTVTSGDPCPGEEPPEEVNGGGTGGSGGSGSNGGVAPTGSGSGDGNDATALDGSGSSARGENAGGRHQDHGGNSKGRSGKGAPRNARGQGEETGPLAGARTDVPDLPSAIEGIPIDGLLVTLAVAALIGAAAGKIYVSLSGDES